MKQAGATIPTTVIHYVPSGATINATGDYWVNVTSAKGTAKGISGDFMQVRENDWYDEENPAQVKSLPRAMCFADTGCSVGVTEYGNATGPGPSRKVHAAGFDAFHVVSDMNSLPDDFYIAIDAGPSYRAAALTHDGTIILKGQPYQGEPLPTGSGFTDIFIGPDYGTALREAGPERHLTGPISPGFTIACREGTQEFVPLNALVVHTENGVTRVFSREGDEVFWANDREATTMSVPGNRELPSTGVYIIPSESVVNSSIAKEIVINNPAGLDPVITVKTEAIVPSTPGSSSGVYYIGKGGSVTSTVDNNVFMAPIIENMGQNSQSTESFFEVMRDEQGMNILCNDQADHLACTGIISTSQDAGPTIPQTLNFSIIFDGTNSESESQVNLAAESHAFKDGNTIHYTITAKSSEKLPRIEITPHIYRSEIWGPNHTATGSNYICSETDHCSISGTYELTDPGAYFVEGRVNFTTSSTLINLGSPDKFSLLPESERIQKPSKSARVTTNQYIKQVENKDIYLWGYLGSVKENFDPPEKGYVNVIVYNTDQWNFITKVGLASGLSWTSTNGLWEWGYSGQTLDTMTWKEVSLSSPYHISKGLSINDQSAGGRYHCGIFYGGDSTSLGNKWIFSGCHHEYFGTDEWYIPHHYIYPNGFNEGRAEFEHDLAAADIVNRHTGLVDFTNNEHVSYADGFAWVMTLK